jgi:hypothetical protein
LLNLGFAVASFPPTPAPLSHRRHNAQCFSVHRQMGWGLVCDWVCCPAKLTVFSDKQID